jgi:hypothetical protein
VLGLVAHSDALVDEHAGDAVDLLDVAGHGDSSEVGVRGVPYGFFEVPDRCTQYGMVEGQKTIRTPSPVRTSTPWLLLSSL